MLALQNISTLEEIRSNLCNKRLKVSILLLNDLPSAKAKKKKQMIKVVYDSTPRNHAFGPITIIQ